MTELTEPTEQPPEPAVEPPIEPPSAPAARRSLLPWLTGAGFVILAAGLFWVWRHPAFPPLSEQTDTMAREISALEARVGRLEQRPPPQLPDLDPLAARVAALERRPVAAGAAPAPAAPDLGPLQTRVSALEQRQAPSLAPLETRMAAIEARQSAESQLAVRITALENADASMQARIVANDKAARRMALVQSASAALATGQKLGDLPGAPSALTRFANTNPPTEAALRLAFPQAARQALGATHPVDANKPLLTRLWAQAQDLVTVRQGDHVLVGDPTAGVLGRARTALDAGDLSSAVTDVATLQGAAGQAMATWLAQARALLDARTALAAWAASD
jgi:hypothetical protein